MADATARNTAFYGETNRGQQDYWRYMAAPRHRVRVLRRAIRRLRPSSVVDLGCGGGQLLEALDNGTLDLAGIDLSEAQIEDNRTRLPHIEWHAADLAAELPPDLAARSYDVIVCSELVEHLDEPARLLAGARALGTHLVLSTQSGPVRPTEVRVGHVRHYSRSEMAELLRTAGWEPVRVWNTGFPFHDLSKWVANRRPDAAMDRFGGEAYGPVEHTVSAALRIAFRLNSHRRGAQLFAIARR